MHFGLLCPWYDYSLSSFRSVAPLDYATSRGSLAQRPRVELNAAFRVGSPMASLLLAFPSLKSQLLSLAPCPSRVPYSFLPRSASQSLSLACRHARVVGGKNCSMLHATKKNARRKGSRRRTPNKNWTLHAKRLKKNMSTKLKNQNQHRVVGR